MLLLGMVKPQNRATPRFGRWSSEPQFPILNSEEVTSLIREFDIRNSESGVWNPTRYQPRRVRRARPWFGAPGGSPGRDVPAPDDPVRRRGSAGTWSRS